MQNTKIVSSTTDISKSNSTSAPSYNDRKNTKQTTILQDDYQNIFDDIYQIMNHEKCRDELIRMHKYIEDNYNQFHHVLVYLPHTKYTIDVNATARIVKCTTINCDQAYCTIFIDNVEVIMPDIIKNLIPIAYHAKNKCPHYKINARNGKQSNLLLSDFIYTNKITADPMLNNKVSTSAKQYEDIDFFDVDLDNIVLLKNILIENNKEECNIIKSINLINKLITNINKFDIFDIDALDIISTYIFYIELKEIDANDKNRVILELNNIISCLEKRSLVEVKPTTEWADDGLEEEYIYKLKYILNIMKIISNKLNIIPQLC